MSVNTTPLSVWPLVSCMDLKLNGGTSVSTSSSRSVGRSASALNAISIFPRADAQNSLWDEGADLSPVGRCHKEITDMTNTGQPTPDRKQQLASALESLIWREEQDWEDAAKDAAAIGDPTTFDVEGHAEDVKTTQEL